jgi:hypothetical protein
VSPGHAGVVPDVVGGQDVEEGRLEHPVRMIERHAERRARATVVAGDEELLEAELAHDLDLVLRHAPERVVGVVRPAARLRAVAVAAQIGRHHGEVPREPRRDALPAQVGERVAVQEEQRRSNACTPADDGDLRIGGLDLDGRERRRDQREP